MVVTKTTAVAQSKQHRGRGTKQSNVIAEVRKYNKTLEGRVPVPKYSHTKTGAAISTTAAAAAATDQQPDAKSKITKSCENASPNTGKTRIMPIILDDETMLSHFDEDNKTLSQTAVTPSSSPPSVSATTATISSMPTNTKTTDDKDTADTSAPKNRTGTNLKFIDQSGNPRDKRVHSIQTPSPDVRELQRPCGPLLHHVGAKRLHSDMDCTSDASQYFDAKRYMTTYAGAFVPQHHSTVNFDAITSASMERAKRRASDAGDGGLRHIAILYAQVRALHHRIDVAMKQALGNWQQMHITLPNIAESLAIYAVEYLATQSMAVAVLYRSSVIRKDDDGVNADNGPIIVQDTDSDNDVDVVGDDDDGDEMDADQMKCMSDVGSMDTDDDIHANTRPCVTIVGCWAPHVVQLEMYDTSFLRAKLETHGRALIDRDSTGFYAYYNTTNLLGHDFRNYLLAYLSPEEIMNNDRCAVVRCIFTKKVQPVDTLQYVFPVIFETSDDSTSMRFYDIDRNPNKRPEDMEGCGIPLTVDCFDILPKLLPRRGISKR